jgi:uncharacterized protein (TIGR00255 family)
MRSMTGHGRGVAEGVGRRVTVEIRAVNHRFLDLKLRSPWLDARVEDGITAALRKRVERGAFTVTIRDEGGGRGTTVQADIGAARAVFTAMEEVRLALGYQEPVALGLILSQPGVLVAGEPADADAVLTRILPALESALDELIAMRRQEGATLAIDLTARLARLEALAADVTARSVTAPEEWRRRLSERIEKLLAGVALDPARVAHEVAVIADRTDVTEEVVRLRSHLAQAAGLLAEDVPVGRRLDFLVQEIGREINTIGSKAQAVEVTRGVVEAKAELEKIREQVQNIE